MIKLTQHWSTSILRDEECHSFGVISLVSVDAPTEASDLTVKVAFYAALGTAVDHSSIHWDHNLYRALLLLKQSLWLLAAILDRSPLRHRLISAPGKILFESWGISMHRLAQIGMVVRHVLVPMGLEL